MISDYVARLCLLSPHSDCIVGSQGWLPLPVNYLRTWSRTDTETSQLVSTMHTISFQCFCQKNLQGGGGGAKVGQFYLRKDKGGIDYSHHCTRAITSLVPRPSPGACTNITR